MFVVLPSLSTEIKNNSKKKQTKKEQFRSQTTDKSTRRLSDWIFLTAFFPIFFYFFYHYLLSFFLFCNLFLLFLFCILFWYPLLWRTRKVGAKKSRGRHILIRSRKLIYHTSLCLSRIPFFFLPHRRKGRLICAVGEPLRDWLRSCKASARSSALINIICEIICTQENHTRYHLNSLHLRKNGLNSKDC